jgi:hypothetical protein
MPIVGGTKAFTRHQPTTTAGGSVLVAANENRRYLAIYNEGATKAYLAAGTVVSSTNGIPLGGGSVLVDQYSTDAWYAITAAGTADLRVLEIS